MWWGMKGGFGTSSQETGATRGHRAVLVRVANGPLDVTGHDAPRSDRADTIAAGGRPSRQRLGLDAGLSSVAGGCHRPLRVRKPCRFCILTARNPKDRDPSVRGP